MAMLAFEDDSHFARKAEIAILRFSKKGWPLIVGGETVLCIDAYSRDFWRNLITGWIMPSCFDKSAFYYDGYFNIIRTVATLFSPQVSFLSVSLSS